MNRFSLLAFTCLATLNVAVDRIPPGPPINIIAEKIPLRTAFAQLAKQSQMPLELNLDEEDNPTLNLNLKGVTFWQALDQIATSAGLQVQLHRSDGKIELYKRGTPGKTPVSYSNGFRVALRKISTFHDFVNNTQGCTLTLEAAWDASFEPLYLETRPHQLSLRDDKGKVIEPKTLGSLWSPVDGRRALSFEVTLPALPRGATKIASLKGVLPVRGSTRMHEFRWKELSLLELSKEKLPLLVSAGKGETTCSVESVELSARRWTVQIATELPASGPEFESFQTWYVNNKVFLQSRDSKKTLQPNPPVQQSAGSKKAVIDYTFTDEKGKRGEAKDWVLICQAPAKMIEVSIPFEFKDVPLP